MAAKLLQIRSMSQPSQNLSLAVNATAPRGPDSMAPAPKPVQPPRARTDHLSGAQKAAIIVRLLLAEGLDMPVNSLPQDSQTLLTQTLGSMRLVDRATMNAVVAEFVDILEQVGLSFPEGVEGALKLLDGKLADPAARQLRAMVQGSDGDDPWIAVELADDDDILGVIDRESMIVGAVLLSKLSTEKAARLLARLPSTRAQELALSIARTENIAPDAVARIGAALAAQLSERPERAFAVAPSKRVGDILNSSAASLRDAVLAGLESADQGFAQGVRKSIFTFQDIPSRIAPRDVPSIMRDAPEDAIKTIIATADPADGAATTFLLENMSKRMAETLKEDAADLPPPSPKQHEDALAAITSAIRKQVDTGALTLLPPPDAA